MPERRLTEDPIGVQDGVNTIFETPSSYQPTTVFVYWNGILQGSEFVIELAGNTKFEVCEAPDSDDEFKVDYVTIV